MTPRFWIPPELLCGPGVLALSPEAAHHASRVLRLQSGDAIEVFDGAGRSANAHILELARDQCRVQIGALADAPKARPGATITLMQGVAAADRMDWIVEKSIELGVTQIIPVLCQRSVVKLDEDRSKKRHQHWQRIAVAACMQCGQNWLPTITAPLPARTAFAQATANAAARLILDPGATSSFSQLVRARSESPEPESWILAVGPEAGFDPGELAAARQAGFQAVQLGPRVLRTETAGAAALASLQTLLGLF